MGAAEMSEFLSWLAVHEKVSASTQNQAHAALLFLYGKVLQTSIGGAAESRTREEAGEAAVGADEGRDDGTDWASRG